MYGGAYGLYFDWTILLLFPAMILSIYAQAKVNNTFRKYSEIRSVSGYSAAEVARRILDMNGLYQVKVEHIAGQLTDHFDPRTNIVPVSYTHLDVYKRQDERCAGNAERH